MSTSLNKPSDDETVLRSLLQSNQFEPFIRHIRFPHYKNLEAGTKIDFTYPITAIVGQNGSNKSSILRALYGTPEDFNIGDFWFSTAIDPIEDGGGQRNCYIYGYYSAPAKRDVEVLIQRSPRKSNPDSWESSRPVQKHGMELLEPLDDDAVAPGRDKTRWNYIKKHVELLDFRSQLSAFDKFFYHNELRNVDNSIRNKKALARKRAPYLKHAIHTKLTSYSYYGERVLGENRDLDSDEITWISRILGRDFESISIVHHRFYNCDGYTARMKVKDGLNYTEAFAGSGEFAVIMLVAKLWTAPENSLILLDEPEVSLHPGAQERLMQFITMITKKRRHQVIISTHSPSIIRKLPDDAIKVLGITPGASKVQLLAQSSRPETAFLTLGEPIGGAKRSILVEDVLAKSIIEAALRRYDKDLLPLVEIRVVPGGAGTIIGTVMPVLVEQDRTDTLCLLDGDQSKGVRNYAPIWFDKDAEWLEEVSWPNSSQIPGKQDGNLTDIIKEISGVDVGFPMNSGTTEEKQKQRIAAQKRFLDWGHRYARYLPTIFNPDEFVLEKIGVRAKNAKVRFVKMTAESYKLLQDEHPTSAQIAAFQQLKVAEIPEGDTDMEAIARIITNFYARGL